ncbi:hypothetical protein C8J56DRAFT_895992 [Mycena floridula]|nr:hypothetical protein C8J56DRAFT_895992 [Mycena floridula]
MMRDTATNPLTPEAILRLEAHLITADALHSLHPLLPFPHPLMLTGSTTSASIGLSIEIDLPARYISVPRRIQHPSYLNHRKSTTTPTFAIPTAASVDKTLVGSIEITNVAARLLITLVMRQSRNVLP